MLVLTAYNVAGTKARPSNFHCGSYGTTAHTQHTAMDLGFDIHTNDAPTSNVARREQHESASVPTNTWQINSINDTIQEVDTSDRNL